MLNWLAFLILNEWGFGIFGSMREVFHSDFVDFMKALNDASVRYLLVGGYAVIMHGYQRSTGDLDIWVEPTEDNFDRLQTAMRIFGLPSVAIARSDFLNPSGMDVFTFGRPPVSIDILTKVKGLDFAESSASAKEMHIQGIKVRTLGVEMLIKAKKITARHKDLDDVEHLQQEEE